MLDRFASRLLIASTLLASACQGKPSPASHELTPEEKEAVAVINKVRERDKVAPVTADMTLCLVARAHAEELAASEGKTRLPDEWILRELRSHGYTGPRVETITLDMAELKIKESIEKVALIKYRLIYLNKEHEICGVGIAQHEGRGKFYITQLFAPKRG